MANPSPSCIESLAHWLQVLNLTHSWFNIFAWLVKPVTAIITFYQGIRCNKGDYLYHKRLVHGDNFCCAGGVWLGEFDDIKQALLEPQARGYKLASSALDPKHVPVAGGRLNFLLALSQRGAGGNGDWEAYRTAVEDCITGTEETKLRMGDDTAKKLLEKLVQEYKATGMTGDFFDNNDRGLPDFLLKYLHYVLFGLDPDDEDKMHTLNDFHYDSTSAAYYLKTIGNTLQCLKFRGWPKKIQAVAKIYQESPSISKFEPNQAKYNNMTKNELALLMVAIMSLAGMVGPWTLAVIVLGRRPLNPYEGKTTSDIDVTKVWDALNLNDRDEVKRYVYECGRLRNPVSNSHRVATEKFTVKMGGRNVTFKKGTVIFIPLLFAGINESVWGKTTFEFDHNRENLCPFATMFHSFGEQTNGRICPGKHVAEQMMIDVLIALGKYRREAS